MNGHNRNVVLFLTCYRLVLSDACLLNVGCVDMFGLAVWLACVVPNLCTFSSQQSESIVSNANGLIGSRVSAEQQGRLPSLDKATQTEPTMSALSRHTQSLHLEDGLPPTELMLDGTRGKLHRVPGMEDEEEEDQVDEEVGGDQEKETSWASSVEEPIQPTTVRSLQREECLDRSCSPDEPASLGSDQNLSLRSGPLSPIQEGEKTLCVSQPHRCFLHNQVNLAWLFKTQSTLILSELDSANPSCAATGQTFSYQNQKTPRDWGVVRVCFLK